MPLDIRGFPIDRRYIILYKSKLRVKEKFSFRRPVKIDYALGRYEICPTRGKRSVLSAEYNTCGAVYLHDETEFFY